MASDKPPITEVQRIRGMLLGILAFTILAVVLAGVGSYLLGAKQQRAEIFMSAFLFGSIGGGIVGFIWPRIPSHVFWAVMMLFPGC